METMSDIEKIPTLPAIYAMYGGDGRTRYVAYVGVARNLRQRIRQHLVSQDSSVVTGVTAVGLHPEHVREVRWWLHSDFEDLIRLAAAELLAFDVLDPALWSRGGIRDEAKALYQDARVREQMEAVFRGEPSGRMEVLTLPRGY